MLMIRTVPLDSQEEIIEDVEGHSHKSEYRIATDKFIARIVSGKYEYAEIADSDGATLASWRNHGKESI